MLFPQSQRFFFLSLHLGRHTSQHVMAWHVEFIEKQFNQLYCHVITRKGKQDKTEKKIHHLSKRN